MKKIKVTIDLAKEYGLTEDEYHRIVESLNREPTHVELGIFSSYWSEVISFKKSGMILQSLPQKGKYVLEQSKGQHVGYLNIGDENFIAVHMSSCSFNRTIPDERWIIENLNQLATSGARPVAFIYSGCCVDYDKKDSRKIYQEITSRFKSICEGLEVKTIQSRVTYDHIDNNHHTITKMAVGVLKRGKFVYSIASGTGNPVFLVGAKTGMATLDIAAQKGILQAAHELTQRNYLIGMRSIHIGGLSAAIADLSVNGSAGITINIKKIPLYKTDLTPFEIIQSETPGRILIVVNRGFEKEIIKIFERFGVPCSRIGTVNDDENVKILDGKKKIATIPLSVLVDREKVPAYKLRINKPKHLEDFESLNLSLVKLPDNYNKTLITLLGSSNVVNSGTIQFDFKKSSLNSDIISIDGTDKAIITHLSEHRRISRLDPKMGGKSAITSAVRNVVCMGARPIAALVSMNLGDPSITEALYLFKEAVDGIREGCLVLNIPVVDKHINHDNGYSAPIVGVVGLFENVDQVITPQFKDPGDFILILGSHRGELGGSEYLNKIHKMVQGPPPAIDLEMEKRVHELILMINSVGLLKSAYALSFGGLAVALAHCTIGAKNNLGARIHMSSKIRNDELLFGETQGVIVVTIEEDSLIEIERICMKLGVACTAIGRVTDTGMFTFNDLISMKVEKMKKVHFNRIEKLNMG